MRLFGGWASGSVTLTIDVSPSLTRRVGILSPSPYSHFNGLSLGMQDTENRTCQFTRDIGNVVRSLGDIDAFVLLFKGETNRLTPNIRQQINIFQQLFGVEFWRKVIIEITFWPHDRISRKKRAKGRKKTEKEKTDNWQKTLRSEMGVPLDVPLVFIDGVIDGVLNP